MMGGQRIAKMIYHDTDHGIYDHHWIDHRRIKGDCFISEPYWLYEATFAELVSFCKRHDLEWMISGDSKHNPSQCLKITVKEKTGTWSWD